MSSKIYTFYLLLIELFFLFEKLPQKKGKQFIQEDQKNTHGLSLEEHPPSRLGK